VQGSYRAQASAQHSGSRDWTRKVVLTRFRDITWPLCRIDSSHPDSSAAAAPQIPGSRRYEGVRNGRGQRAQLSVRPERCRGGCVVRASHAETTVREMKRLLETMKYDTYQGVISIAMLHSCRVHTVKRWLRKETCEPALASRPPRLELLHRPRGRQERGPPKSKLPPIISPKDPASMHPVSDRRRPAAAMRRPVCLSLPPEG
jgi:hypothetical protein